MKQKQLIIAYSFLVHLTGLVIFLLGNAFDPVSVFSGIEGARQFSTFIKVMGGCIGLAGLVGIVWGIVKGENVKLPGYLGLTGGGIILVLLPFFVFGPIWLLFAWTLWFVKPFRIKTNI